jgi:endoglucanase
VLLDCHNYGRYKIDGTNEQILGTLQVPNSVFADFWRKVADRYKNESAVYGYGVINEPHDIGDDGRWLAAAQAAIDEIRKVDAAHTVFVAGDHWGGAYSWRNTSNEDLDIRDPVDKLVYEAHQYFHNDHSGTYQPYDSEGAYPDVGVDWARPFVEWLHAKGRRGFSRGVRHSGQRPTLEHSVSQLSLLLQGQRRGRGLLGRWPMVGRLPALRGAD